MPVPRTVVLAAALRAAALLAASSLAAPARAGDTCVAPEVAAALADCSAATSLPALSPADLLATASAAPTAMAMPKRVRGGPALAPRPFDAREAMLAGAFQRFACDDKPASGDVGAADRHLEVAYRRARLYFAAQHFQEAAVLFRAIATTAASANAAASPFAIYATQLYLESINGLGAHGAAACYDDMARDVPIFVGLQCQGGREKTNTDACAVLDRIQRDIARLAAENDVRAASRLPREQAMDRFRAGAERYLEIWRRHGEAACVARAAGCDRMEEILYNAARAFQAARDVPRSIAVRQLLLDPRYHLDGTELARKARYEIGSVYHALGEWEQAATWYERFAAASPKGERAWNALEDAVALRLALGDEEQAVRDGDLFNRSYGAARPAESATIAFAVAAHDVDKERWADARRKLTAAMGLIDRDATLDVQMQAHALLGRALARVDTHAKAASELAKVRAYWRDPAAAVRRIDDASGGDPRKLGKALTALGEALFFFAEEKRAAAEAIRLPAYGGSGRRDDIAELVATKLAPAMTAKRMAVEEAERAYAEVLAIQPMPPPKWVVAAASRVAQMRGRLAAELRALPAPRTWRRQGASPWGTSWEDVRATWRDTLIDASEPDHRAAHAAYRRCVDLSLKFQGFGDDARRCGAWLERSFPAEAPTLDEIVPRLKLGWAFDVPVEPEPDPRASP